MSDNIKYVQAQAFILAGAGVILGDTTVVLSSFNGIDGAPLTMTDFGDAGFATLEPNSGTQEEQIVFMGVTQNANGTATLTGISNVLFIAPYTQTSGFAKTHAGGVKLVISNTSGFYNTFVNKNDDETITGTWTFTEPEYPQMTDVNVFPTLPVQLVPKAYADSLTFNGAPNASPTVQGLVQEATTSQLNAGTNTGSTGAVLFGSPADFAASIYGLQLPTSGQKSALVGNNTDVAVGSGNKYVTETGLIHSAEKYATTTGSANAYVATLSPVPTSLTAGMTLTLIANFSNTGATTLAVNGLGSTPAITKNGTTALQPNDILSGQAFTVTWDGTRWQLQSPSSNSIFLGLFSNGIATHDTSSTGAENIAHGLGVTPKYIKVTIIFPSDTNNGSISFGSYNGTTISNVFSQVNINSSSTGLVTPSNSTTVIATAVYSSGNIATAVPTFNSTNIVLTWSNSGSPSGSALVFWEAQA